ncbi:beta-1 3-galactosyltransferase 1 [Biomphalaria glabrata]|uniref:Hexosyltransferase n=1 Tax=Biomphalaria glabrata TaxID=6526 RepID=A0A9U8EA63_BIOGL|nr:beta-1,3-galactosyltransferase 1-like [Biomphalaria glabrata]KAI8754108.1 beta-1; 3-galactosyltransferase 1-like [Biomphalaria glabrata]
MVLKRYFNVDIFRSSFSRFMLRFMLLSALIAGFLLVLLSMTHFPRSTKATSTRLYYTRLAANSTSDLNRDSSDVSKPKSSVVTPKDNTPKESQHHDIKWQSEYFPELEKDPVLQSIVSRYQSKMNQRKRKLVNENNFQYIHNVPNACVGRKVKLIVGVPSRTDSFEARQAVRETWGQYALVPANNAVVLFFLGVQPDRAGQEHIDAEALKFGDIVQEDFEDTYRNLSLKSIAIMNWVSMYCPDSLFVLKADDDMYINVPRLVARLQKQMALGPCFLIGALHSNTSPFRDSKNKWYVTKAEYPEKYFPNYLSGTAYAMTTSAAMRLFIESFYVKLLFLEDVYLTGLVADQASVPRVADEDFSWLKYEASGCQYRDKISGHKNSPEEIRKIHKELYDPNLRCS